MAYTRRKFNQDFQGARGCSWSAGSANRMRTWPRYWGQARHPGNAELTMERVAQARVTLR
jgi:hypothetical protein